MEEDFQNLNPERPYQQAPSIGAERVHSTAGTAAPRIGDSQLQSSSLWTYLSPFQDQPSQTTTYVGVPGVMWSHLEAQRREVTSETTGLSLMTGLIPEADSGIAPPPVWPDGNSWAGSTVFADDQNNAGQSDDSLHCIRGYPLEQGGKSPFSQGNDVQLQFPFLPSNAFHGHVSLQQAQYTMAVPTLSPFRRHAAPIQEGVAEVNRAKMTNFDGRGPEEWLCREDDCKKTYRRSQDLRRHTRDKHQSPHMCPFCDKKWTRPEMIRGHLITKHEDHLTEEELREVRSLRGWNDTVRFVAECRMPKVPQQQHSQYTGPSFIPAPSLIGALPVEPQEMGLTEDGDFGTHRAGRG